MAGSLDGQTFARSRDYVAEPVAAKIYNLLEARLYYSLVRPQILKEDLGTSLAKATLE